jgi:hypothetical protein
MMSLNELPEDERDLFIKMQLENYKTSDNTVTGPSTEGYFGAVYVIRSGQYAWVAKCPKFKEFNSAEETRDYVLKLINEFTKSYSYYHSPWVNRVFDIQIYMGWPFIFWSFKDATLTDLIRNPLNWNLSQKYSQKAASPA